MKINGNQIKIGNVLEHKGSLFVVTKTQAVKPGKGGAFNQVEMKSIIDNTKLNERFRADEIVERVRIDSESYQFLYSNDNELIFMNSNTFEQISVNQSILDEKNTDIFICNYLTSCDFFNGLFISKTSFRLVC